MTRIAQQSAAPARGRAGIPTAEAQRTIPAVLVWASIGAALLAFEIYVLTRWVLGPNFRPSHPGVDPISGGQQALFLVLQIAIPIGAAIALWVWVIRPWRREGRLTTDGMLALSGAMIFFW